jgi:putative hydrolase of the HAD superfamily
MLNPKIAQKIGIPEDKLSELKNIIFDLGGVIIKIRYQATIDAFKKLGFDEFGQLYSLMKQNNLFDLLETGKIPSNMFRAELRKIKNHLSDEQIDNAWIKMIGEMPEMHLPLLKKIRQQYKTFLLSNTNEIHIRYFNGYLTESFGKNTLSDMFDKVYYSHEIGFRKPHTEAFEAVLKDSGIKADETLFIDDLMINIEGTRKAGLWAYHLQDEAVTDLFL